MDNNRHNDVMLFALISIAIIIGEIFSGIASIQAKEAVDKLTVRMAALAQSEEHIKALEDRVIALENEIAFVTENKTGDDTL